MLFPNPGEDFNLALARARGLGVAWFRPPTIALQSAVSDPRRCSIARGSSWRSQSATAAIRRRGQPRIRRPIWPRSANRLPRLSAPGGRTCWWWKTEENSSAFYDGDADAYIAELTAACAIAHQAHAQCSNGGLTGNGAAALTWLGFLSKNQADRACDFAKRALPDETLCAYHTAADVPKDLRARLVGPAETLVQRYKLRRSIW